MIYANLPYIGYAVAASLISTGGVIFIYYLKK